MEGSAIGERMAHLEGRFESVDGRLTGIEMRIGRLGGLTVTVVLGILSTSKATQSPPCPAAQ